MYDVLRLAKVVQEFQEAQEEFATAAKVAFKRLENTYYISDEIFAKLRRHTEAMGLDCANQCFAEEDSELLVHRLATLVYKHDPSNRVRTQLYQIYHHCIHNRLQVAKDLFLMSRISEGITSLEQPLQEVFNKVLVQLGLAAFRLGNIVDTHVFLNDICSVNRIRELMG